MEPIISLLEKKQRNTDTDGCLKPIDDLTFIDPIHKSTLLDAKICVERATTETKVAHETTDEQ